MFNSAINKSQYNNSLDKSALFDFSKQGLSPLLLKSKFSFYDQEIKETNLYQNEHYPNKDFLRNSLLKEKLEINVQNKVSSPFSLNFMERRNSLTNQGIQHSKKVFSIDKNFACFNPNLNLPTNNIDKNYLFDSNLGRNGTSNYMISNALTGSNSNIFKTFKFKSNEKAKEIKYADDYSFKKKNISSEIVNLREDKDYEKDEQSEHDEIKEVSTEKIKLRRSSRLNVIENGPNTPLQLKKKNSLAIEKKIFKKFKKLSKTKQTKNNNNSKNNQNAFGINNVEKEKRDEIAFLQKSANLNSNNKAKEETLKENIEIKGFSFLKQKRKANIGSSLFGGSSANRLRNKMSLQEKEEEIFKRKLTMKFPNKDFQEEDSYSSNSSPPSVESESEYLCSREINKTKTQIDKKTILNGKKEIKEPLEKSKFKVERNLKTKATQKLNVDDSNTTKNAKNQKEICFSLSKSSKKNELDDHSSPPFSFGFENKKKEEKKEKELKEEKYFCEIFNLKDSLKNFPVRNNRFSISHFNDIFAQKTLSFKKNKTKKIQTMKNIISLVDAKTSRVKPPKYNEINFDSKALNKSNLVSENNSNKKENNNSENEQSIENPKKNVEYLYDSFDDDEPMKKFSTYRNNKVKDLMIEYIVWGKPNNKRLNFGDCPLNVYTDFFMRGKEEHSKYETRLEDRAYLSTNFKGKNPKRNFMKFTLQKLHEIVLSMQEIRCKLSQYPIFDLGLELVNKNKNKENRHERIEDIQFTKARKISRTNITEKVLAKKSIKKRLIIDDDNGSNNNGKEEFKKPKLTLKSGNSTAKKIKNRYTEDQEDSYYSDDSDDFNDEPNSDEKKKPENESKDMAEGYECEICGQIFSNGQGLGGHMSRKHPNQSEKYKNKKETRERRNSKREILYKAQKILLSRFRQDYEKLKLTQEGRRVIKKICKEHKTEYYQIKREIKTSRNSQRLRKSKN